MTQPDQINLSEQKPLPPRNTRWSVLLFVSLAMFANYYVFDAMNPVGPMLEADLGFTQAQIGLLDTAYNVAALIVLLLGGVIIDRAGTKKSMILFSVVATIGGIVISLSPSPQGMMIGRFVLGMGSEPLIVAATTVLGQWFKAKQLSFAMAINLTIARLGSVAADNSRSIAGGLFTSWQPPLVLAAAVGALCIVGGVVYAIIHKNSEKKYSLGASSQTDKLVWSELFKFGKQYWLVVGLCVTFYSAIFPFRRFANIIFVDMHGVTPETAAFLNGLLPMTAMVATPLFGLLVDYIGKRALLLTVGALMLIPSFLLLAYSSIAIWIPVAMLGISFSLVPAILWPSVAYLVDEHRLGTAYALMTFCQQIGWGITSWLIGATNDTFMASSTNTGGYIPGLWIFASLGIFGMLSAYFLWMMERKPSGLGLETITVKK